VNGTYTGIGGAGGAYEDEKAAFALNPCIKKFRGWVDHSKAGYALWLRQKEYR